MKKVLFVMHSLGFGGAEKSLVNLLNEMPRDKYQIDLLLFHKKDGFVSQVPGWVNMLKTPEALERLYAPMQSAGKYRFRKIAGTICSKLYSRKKKAQKAFRWRHVYVKCVKPLEQHYDVAVAYVGAEIMYFIRDCVSADRKLVWIHNDYRTAGYSKEDDAPYFVDMDAIVSVSEKCVEVLNEEFPEHSSKTYYIENITSSAVVRKMAKAYVPEEYENGVYNLLSIGRLWPQKGFDMAIDAAAILKEKGLNFRWFIIGIGSLEDKLRRQIAENNLQEQFILLGTRKNPYPYIKGCSVFVQPSRYEGKSVALDEAKIMCAPIVATAYPTVGDQLTDRKEGLITQMSPEGIAAGILEVIENEGLRTSMQEYLGQHEYGNQKEVEKYMQLLDAE